MGSWGVKINQNNVSSEVIDFFSRYYNKCTDSAMCTLEALRVFDHFVKDTNENAAYFWFGLAYQQWKFGVLLDEVKQKALEYLDRSEHLEPWKLLGEKTLNKRLEILKEFREMITSPMPSAKVVKLNTPKPYICEWKIGDIYAYKFSGVYSNIKGYLGKYLIFIKAYTIPNYPHVSPVIFTFYPILDHIPSIEEVKSMELMTTHESEHNIPKYQNYRNARYGIELVCTSKQSIPYKHLTYIGYCPEIVNSVELFVTYADVHPIFWKHLEEVLINRYNRHIELGLPLPKAPYYD